ncbi:MAG TPA: hypothetical protein VGQ53_13760 [Chitinophagaceae bacterium]|nr:hypothetical protein [Chitinophagaceae bacterium]
MHAIRCKVIEVMMFVDADFGGGNIQPRTVTASKSAAFFFAPFFWTSKRKERKVRDQQQRGV